VVIKPALLGLVAASLLAAVAGGLLRAGAGWTGPAGTLLAGRAAAGHAALMMCGFLGTVVAIERAVAVKRRLAWAAPLLSGLAGALLLAGLDRWAAVCWSIAGVVFVGVNVVVVRRQRAAHTVLLLVAAGAWLAGNLVHAAGRSPDGALAWWFAFLVLTIAAERLEMTRLMRRHPAARPSLHAICCLLVGAATLCTVDGAAGGFLYGTALVALALWLGVFDIARRTALSHGLARYMAVCLLGGYAWLGVAGLAWCATALGAPMRDVALHALGLGFVFAMVMGHAPVILPAVARIKLLFGAWFYLPLAMLHGSLLVRLLGGSIHPALRAAGASLNAATLALFVLTVAGSAMAWHLRHAPARLPS
jgi:hypothetical protein